jgi:acetyl esterase/lipase
MTRLTRYLILAAAMVLGPVAQAADVPDAGRPETMAYGTDPLQALDFWRARDASRPAPLIVFVHGGGWSRGDKRMSGRSAQAGHFLSTGYAYASINYRLVPSATVEAEAADVAASLKYLLDHAAQLGVDRRRVVLMGHSAGAHLSALVGTDERYLQAVGLKETDVAGVILLDGAAYDVASQVQQAGRFMSGTYREAFGTDPVRQRALSPTQQAAAPNAPRFLILHIQRDDAVRQSRALGEALRAAGTPAEVQGLPGEGMSGHREINRELGEADYPGTAIVDRWLAGLPTPR